ncbi:unnamed protein product [Phytophthora lilii]|uniref:Unnamed protein product n=1 Tax=Phytophthora lilii TaxID=2077276 RepID=A0A9W6TZZ9_9STRA|nr:unnamed protein product [Phytophthora lilii]
MGECDINVCMKQTWGSTDAPCIATASATDSISAFFAANAYIVQNMYDDGGEPSATAYVADGECHTHFEESFTVSRDPDSGKITLTQYSDTSCEEKSTTQSLTVAEAKGDACINSMRLTYVPANTEVSSGGSEGTSTSGSTKIQATPRP